MTDDEARTYPPEAYADDGLLWWDHHDQKVVPGTKGAVPRMAAWLRWNVEPGQRFSTRELRDALGIDQEHFQRRQRELRDYGWRYLSAKEDPSLGEQCELIQYGWWPGQGPRPRRQAISAKVRRQVFERDGGRCVLCGRAAGEFYEDGARVVLTAGHVVANSHGGSADLDNLRTECRRCNESARADTGTAADPQAIVEAVRSLRRADQRELLDWIRRGQRTRSKLDHVHDQVRMSGPAAMKAVVEYLEELERREGGREAR
ncbi:HNH endonuclease [Actinomyces ruminicola]|uniref:HNH endonuclease n=1 Tax=Actinomyces ruminicola TaxID=332524 RepID=A0A1H0EEE4_9ACTO|nr:HNH endonuclease [Actinomyces ruminicola]SDN80688.1 HNH endonuclease [Actinomyces ruminicola]